MQLFRLTSLPEEIYAAVQYDGDRHSAVEIIEWLVPLIWGHRRQAKYRLVLCTRADGDRVVEPGDWVYIPQPVKVPGGQQGISIMPDADFRRLFIPAVEG